MAATPPTDITPEPALPHVAAIVDDRGVVMDAFLTGIVRRLQAEGHALRGCLMQRPDTAGCVTMHLLDVHTGESYLVSQPMGSGSTACRADPQGFARASRIFQNALAERPELVVSNRFGDLEARGEGFNAELLALLAQGLPLLTTVAERNVPAWQAFTGGAVLLPADEAAVLAWAHRVLGR